MLFLNFLFPTRSRSLLDSRIISIDESQQQKAAGTARYSLADGSKEGKVGQ